MSPDLSRSESLVADNRDRLVFALLGGAILVALALYLIANDSGSPSRLAIPDGD